MSAETTGADVLDAGRPENNSAATNSPAIVSHDETPVEVGSAMAARSASAEQAAVEQLVEIGCALFVAPFAGWGKGTGEDGKKCGYWLPKGWQHTDPKQAASTAATYFANPNQTGALCMVTGHGIDVVDFDPRNGSDTAREMFRVEGLERAVVGVATTPSGGEHLFVPAAGVAKSTPRSWPGVDYQAGGGFVFLAPTLKMPKGGGEPVRYAWTTEPDAALLDDLAPDGAYAEELAQIHATARMAASPPAALGAPFPGRIPFADLDEKAQAEVTKYAHKAITATASTLVDLHAWPVGRRDERGNGWEKITADAFLYGARIGLDPTVEATLEQVRDHLTASAPTDATWTKRAVVSKWNSQVRAAREKGAISGLDKIVARCVARETRGAESSDPFGFPDESDPPPTAPLAPLPAAGTADAPTWLRGVGEYEYPRDWRAPAHLSPSGQEDDPQRYYFTRSGDRVRMDEKVERSLAGLVDAAQLRHPTEHDVAMDPTCLDCERRLRGYMVEVTWPTSEVVAIEGRVRGILYRDGQLPDATPQASGGGRRVSWAEILALKAPSFIVDNVLPSGGVGYLIGRDQSYKTFLALSFAASRATMQTRWHGEKFDPGNGRTMYVFGEGLTGLQDRLPAQFEALGVPMDSESVERLAFWDKPLNLFDGGEDYDRFLLEVAESKPGLVIIDTLSKNSGGADHNSATDMGLIYARLAAIRDACGGCVLVVAHTGKADTSDEVRGSSAIEDDADFVIFMKKAASEPEVIMKVTKQKDGTREVSKRFRARQVGRSVVLGEPQPEPAVASHHIEQRILRQLRREIAPVTRRELEDSMKGDGHGAVPSSARNALTGLVKGGAVNSDGAKTTRYSINPDWTNPLEEQARMVKS